jgi:hypothetical protein
MSFVICTPMYMIEGEVQWNKPQSSYTGSIKILVKLALAKDTPLKGGESGIARLFLVIKKSIIE